MFILGYDNKGWLKQIKEKIIDMVMNGSGIRDTARVLQISQETVMSIIKKGEKLVQVNENVLLRNDLANDAVDIIKVDEAEADEMWSFVQNMGKQR